METNELHQTSEQFQSAQKDSSVQQIEFHFKNGQTVCIKDEALLKLLLDTSVIGLENLEYKALVEEFGEFRINVKDTPEYNFAMEFEKVLNNMYFSNKDFVESIPFFHRTLQQKLFRLFRDSFLYMASLDARRYVDDRNQEAYELSQKLAATLQDSYLPSI